MDFCITGRNHLPTPLSPRTERSGVRQSTGAGSVTLNWRLLWIAAQGFGVAGGGEWLQQVLRFIFERRLGLRLLSENFT
jgi:hypothetical protein